MNTTLEGNAGQIMSDSAQYNSDSYRLNFTDDDDDDMNVFKFSARFKYSMSENFRYGPKFVLHLDWLSFRIITVFFLNLIKTMVLSLDVFSRHSSILITDGTELCLVSQ